MKKTNPQVLSLINNIEAELRKLKTEYRDPTHQPPRLAIYRELDLAKHRATVLYSHVAHQRGRVHHHGWTMEQQTEFLNKYLGRLLEAATAAVA